MRYGILGSLELVDGGRRLEVTGAKQRALLASLLLNANRVVSSERLIDALWEDDVPETAAKALQVHVSQLRKVLGRHRLETEPPGYRLRVEPDALDLDVFQRLCEGGELDEALALWRGPPLAEFASARFAQADIARLEELRLGCLEERIDRDLARGRHSELVGELEGLVLEHPLREQLRCTLMLALYRAGRQAEALDVYQHARTALVDELGIEPGRSLRELHQAILNQEPSLDLRQAEETADAPAASVGPSGPDPGVAVADARKIVTALFVGLGVSCAPGEVIDPETLRRITGRAFALVDVAVEQHGGIVETVAGDGLTALFGLPIAHEDDAVRGVRTAVAVREALAAFTAELDAEQGLQLAVRIGISTGEVVSAVDTALNRRTIGEPLLAASQLGRAASPGEIRFDEGARRLLRAAVRAEEADGGWQLLGLSDVAPARRLVSPMVGRERERRRLRDVFGQARSDRSCQLFTVLGVAGVGKSRLVHEFVESISGQALVARGRCLPYGQGITYWPLLEAVTEAVGLSGSDTPDEALAQIRDALGGGEGAELVAQRVAETIGLAEVVAGAEDGFLAVQQLFESLARQKPVVVVFDDIHWAEVRFLDLIEHLADWVRDAPILVLCLARPELFEARPARVGAS